MQSGLFQQINSFPMLKPDEEKAIWAEYFAENTSEARKDALKERVITSHLRLAMKMAQQWKRSRLPVEDLFGSAQAGLLEAFNRFDPEKGFAFNTYARWWVKADLQAYVMANSSSIKTGTTAFQKFLFFNYAKLEAEIRSDNPEISSHQLDVVIAQKCIDEGHCDYTDHDKVLEEIATYKTGRAQMSSLDAPLKDDSESGSRLDFVEDRNHVPALDLIMAAQDMDLKRSFLVAAAAEMIAIGKEREWEILKARRLDDPKQTLEELSEVYGVSRERVRQIEVRAFERLQQFAARPDFFALAKSSKPKISKEKKVPVPKPRVAQHDPVSRVPVNSTDKTAQAPQAPQAPKPTPIANTQLPTPSSDFQEVEFSFERISHTPYRPWQLTLNGEVFQLKQAEKNILEPLLGYDRPISKADLVDSGVKFTPPVVDSLLAQGLLTRFKKEGVKRLIFYSVKSKEFGPEYTPFKNKKDERVVETEASHAVEPSHEMFQSQVIDTPNDETQRPNISILSNVTVTEIPSKVQVKPVAEFKAGVPIYALGSQKPDMPESYEVMFLTSHDNAQSYELLFGNNKKGIVVSSDYLDGRGVSVDTKGLIVADMDKFLSNPDMYLDISTSSQVGLQIQSDDHSVYILHPRFLEKKLSMSQQPSLGTAFAKPVEEVMPAAPLQKEALKEAPAGDVAVLERDDVDQDDVSELEGNALVASFAGASYEEVEVATANIPQDWRIITRQAKQDNTLVNVLNGSGDRVGVLTSMPKDRSDLASLDIIYETDSGEDFEETLTNANGPVILRALSMKDVALFVPNEKRENAEIEKKIEEAPEVVTQNRNPENAVFSSARKPDPFGYNISVSGRGSIEKQADILPSDSSISHPDKTEVLINSDSLSTTNVLQKLGKGLLEEKLGDSTGFHAVAVKKRKNVVGYLVRDDVIPSNIKGGKLSNVTDFRLGFSEVDHENVRIQLGSYNKPNGFSYVTKDVFEQIQAQPEIEPQLAVGEVGKAVQERQPSVDELKVVPEAESSSPIKDLEVGNQATKRSETPYSLTFRETVKQRPWSLDVAGETHSLSEKVKDLAELLLNNSAPISKREIEDQGVEVTPYLLSSLEETGLLHKYNKRGVVRGVYYSCFSSDEPKTITDEFTPYIKPERQSRPLRREFDLIDFGYGDVREKLNSHVDPNEPAFLSSEYDRPEVNPDPSLYDVPYIGLNPDSKPFEKALESFNSGRRDAFQRATKIEDGKAYSGEGRWVYIGSSEVGEKEDLSPYKPHPKTNQMLVPGY